jgi:hypothetical protein
VAESGKTMLPPEGSNDRKAAEVIADVYGCPVEDAPAFGVRLPP